MRLSFACFGTRARTWLRSSRTRRSSSAC
jgi:hypothetical protein